MQLYLKLALDNVRRGARDYSVYFATLGFAACLLYSFVASLTFSYAARKPNRWHGRGEFTRMGAVITLGRTRHAAISQARPRQRASRRT